MSQILTNLIFTELQKISPNPIAAAGQRQLANAIGKAVSTYINTPGNITIVTPPAGIPVPLSTVGAPVGVVTPPLIVKAR